VTTAAFSPPSFSPQGLGPASRPPPHFIPPVEAPAGHRGIGLAVFFSLLAHVAIFLLPARTPTLDAASAGPTGPLTVRIEPAPSPPVAPEEPLPVPRAVPRREAKPTLAMPARPDAKPASPVAPPEPEPEAAPTRPEPTFDMAALVAANRERRAAREARAARGFAAPPSPSEPVAGGLAKNLQSFGQGDDTGGVFRILRIGARTGEFSFNGWRGETGRRWREVIEVDAGTGGDVERAIVRRMMALIREHYSGNFNWESRRHGRVIVLSAAPAQDAELEAFLYREFFDRPLAGDASLRRTR